MAIKRKLPRLNLGPVDELIRVREQLHGGSRGAPKKVGGVREGAAVNASCILMLSALLQGYVEEVFVYGSWRVFRTLRDDEARTKYRATFFRWGNPSGENIKRLFFRIGIPDVIEGLSWQKTDSKVIRRKLDQMNELRNKIAHGAKLEATLSLNQVKSYRSFVEQFGVRFGRHVQDQT